MFKVSVNYPGGIENYTFYHLELALDIYFDACIYNKMARGAKLGYVEEDGSEIEFMTYGKI